jgi:hypothetical protein
MASTNGSAPPIPQDHDAENALVGALILKPERLEDAQNTGLRAADFHDQTNRAIYGAIAAATLEDTGTDQASIAGRLRPMFDDIATVLLARQSACPTTTPASVTRWAERIVKTSTARRVAIEADRLKAAALSEAEDLDDQVANFQAQVMPRDPKSRTLAYQWIHEAVQHPPPEPIVYIDGLLQAGELGVLVAPRKYQKSWASMQMAIALARGEGSTVFSRLKVRRRARVFVAHGELNERGAFNRWDYLTAGEGRPEGIAESFDRWGVRIQSRRSKTLDVSGREWQVEEHVAALDRRLERTIVELGIDVLIIDPWAVFYQGKENSNDEMAAALEELRDLTLRTGVAIWIVHHVSKVTDRVRDPEDLWRGAGRLADWASTGVTMLPHFKGEDGKDGWRAYQGERLNHKKAKWYVDLNFMRRDTPTDDFSVRWNPTNGWFEEWVPPESISRSKSSEPRPTKLNPVDVAARLEASGGMWLSLRTAAEDLGLSAHTATRCLEAAVASDHVEEFEGPKGARAFRLPERSLLDAATPAGLSQFEVDQLYGDEVDDYEEEMV